MAKVNERRINYNEDDYETLKRLMVEEPFRSLNLIDIFAISLIYGKKAGIRTPLDKKKTGRIRQTTIENSNVHYLMMAVAVEETGSFEVLAKRNDYFKICEEYAKTGLSLLEEDFIENPKGLLDDLELEALKYFDKFIKQ
ncbi:MAG: hypothetical protein IJI80_04015 [Methanobrevibacter sp.]|uniref:hypothetical protein n=1 Tax=Methanobrevibacter sp. TaxID=66852 RepID=UPI0025EFA8AB|nr:hypothetical protein [Methanobrevibacter sp.]MBQ6138826.1 hypothetical protein [Methanobrevibacter sp.]